MKIVHVVASIDLFSGGPSKSICDLALEQARRNVHVHIITIRTDNPYFAISPHENLQLDFIEKHHFKLKEILRNQKPDILHGHGIWLPEVHYMASIARELNIPYIISPRGMLEPWALNYKKWKKQIAMWLYQKNDLKKAACIHATAQKEAQNIRNLEYNNPIAVIPNPVELKAKVEKIITEKKRLAFIGRLHEIKNIESLLRAWQKVQNKENWELLLIGDGEREYVNKLKNLTKEFRIDLSVYFKGFLTGEEKEQIIHTLDIVVLPSFSENFGMVVGEALQNEILVIASTGTPWEDLNTYQCGWWINNDVETLAQTIQQAILLSDDERKAMGQRGRKLIEEKYSIEIVAQQMLRLYEWILKIGEKPDLIYQ